MAGPTPHGEVTNQEIWFMLGKLMSDQSSTLDLLRSHIEKQDKRWDHIYLKTDKLGNIITYASGAAATVAILATYVGHKVLGI